MDLTKLTHEEAAVLRGIALLGNVTVGRDVFNEWLGGQHD